jgi:hypothetical protein
VSGNKRCRKVVFKSAVAVGGVHGALGYKRQERLTVFPWLILGIIE